MLDNLLDMFLRMDVRLSEIVLAYKAWTYLIVFAVIMLEAFPLLTPLLPGASVVLMVGILAANGSLNIWWLLPLISLAAAVGDTINYLLGLGVVTLYLRRDRKVQREHPNLARARAFYDRYGGLTLMLGRFLPFVRSAAPTLAGMGIMTYRRFLLFNALGCFLWAAVFLLLGYFFGHVHFVRHYLPLVIVVVTTLPSIPVAVHYFRQRRARTRRPSPPAG